jgi:putative ABC transport system ATP-binding protein
MIALQAVTKQFQHRGKAVTALAGVSLQIAKGDFVAVIGPSGSGKSTLLHLLGGMLSPSEGKVRFGNDSLYDLSADERSAIRKHKIGFVFQTFNLVPYLTALENVQVPLVLAGLGEEGQVRRAELLLKRVGLSDRLDHKPRELSVGEQQRVALARMLANDPILILADEPTGNLDPETADSIMDFLDELNEEGRTIVMVTHDLRLAGRAKRALRLVNGLIQPEGQARPLPAAIASTERKKALSTN